MLAEPLQDELVVQQAMERAQQEDVEGQVANPLLLEVPTQSLHLATGPEDGFYLYKLQVINLFLLLFLLMQSKCGCQQQ